MNLKFKVKRVVTSVKLICFGLIILLYFLVTSLINRFKNMRELVISRISEILIEMPDLQFELGVSVEDLQSMSNMQLLDLYEEIFTDQYL